MPLPQNADTVRRFVAYLHTLHLPPLEWRQDEEGAPEAVYIWYCGGFHAIKQHLPRCKSSQGVQPCCGLRLASAVF